MIQRCLLLAFLLAALGPAPAAAQSLWRDSGDLFADFRAHAPGDLLTILVVESASGENTSATRTKKNSSAGFEGGPGFGALDFIPLVKLEGKVDSEHAGDGSTRQTGEVEAKITARVITVRPNGDLEIEGTRLLTVNGEKQEIRLTGVVRPRDITHDNTVLSTFVGEARVEYAGKGPVTNGTRAGFWKRLFDWVM